MAKQEIGRLSEALARDPELRVKLAQAKDIESVTEAARTAGYSFTTDELRDVVKSLPVELSEEQLAHVAGGASLNFSPGNVVLLPAVLNFYKIVGPTM